MANDFHLGPLPPGEDTPAIPASDHFHMATCEHCPNVHFLFFDEEDRPIAQATMSRQQLQNAIDLLKEEKWSQP